MNVGRTLAKATVVAVVGIGSVLMTVALTEVPGGVGAGEQTPPTATASPPGHAARETTRPTPSSTSKAVISPTPVAAPPPPPAEAVAQLEGSPSADTFTHLVVTCTGGSPAETHVWWQGSLLADKAYDADAVTFTLPALPQGDQQLAVECVNHEGVVVADTPLAFSVAAPSGADARLITYHLDTRGTVKADMTEFSETAARVLSDSRGWPAAGIRFVQVVGDADFTLYLASADQMTSFGGTCSDSWSCSRGGSVIINQDRWLEASKSWLGAGGSLADYRTMVINHEVGHYLGLWHEHCPGVGQVAPVMQQQSMRMEGCVPGPWPTEKELAAVR